MCEGQNCHRWFWLLVRTSFNASLGVKPVSSFYVNRGHRLIDFRVCMCWLMCRWPNLSEGPCEPFLQKQVPTAPVLCWCALGACVTRLGI